LNGSPVGYLARQPLQKTELISASLGVGYVGTNFGTPISQCNGVDLPEQYHRAVFNPVVVDDRAAGAWYQLHENYRAMAIANGVPADDAALTACRD